MRMSRGCDIDIGSVIVVNLLNHLGRVGTAAYAEDLVDAMNTIRQTFTTIFTTPIINPVTIRAC